MIATGPEAASGTPPSLQSSEGRSRHGSGQGSLSRHTAQDCRQPCPLHRNVVTEALQRSIRDEPVVAITPRARHRTPVLGCAACGSVRASPTGAIGFAASARGGRCARPLLRTVLENAATLIARADRREVRQAFALRGCAPVGCPVASAMVSPSDPGDPMVLNLAFNDQGGDSESRGQIRDLLLIQRMTMDALSQAGGRCEEFRSKCAPHLLTA